MKILAVNTSSIEADIALKIDGKEIFNKVDSSAKHSESLMVEIDRLMQENLLDINELDALSLIVGPGSFTGIRIGVSISKGLEFVNTKLKLISITSFEFMAKQFLKDNHNFKGEFVCVIDALSGKLYVQKFNEKMEFVSEGELIEGNNKIINEKTIVGLVAENLPFATHLVEYSAQTLLEIALSKYNENNFVTDFEPLYLRKSQAEDELDKKQGG